MQHKKTLSFYTRENDGDEWVSMSSELSHKDAVDLISIKQVDCSTHCAKNNDGIKETLDILSRYGGKSQYCMLKIGISKN